MTDLLIRNALTVATVDPLRRELSGGWVAITGNLIEAVGAKYLGTYLGKISSLLKNDGLILLQAITISDQEYDRAVNEVDFIKKFIFHTMEECGLAMQIGLKTGVKIIHSGTNLYRITLLVWTS